VRSLLQLETRGEGRQEEQEGRQEEQEEEERQGREMRSQKAKWAPTNTERTA